MFYKILKKNTGLKYSVKEIPQNDYYKHLLILKLTYKVKIDRSTIEIFNALKNTYM